MSLTQSIDIKLFINLAGAKWAAICPLRLSKAGKQFDVNALCKQSIDIQNVQITLNVLGIPCTEKKMLCKIACRQKRFI